MPRISTFGGMTMVLYYNDHDPPHFHVFDAEFETRIEIKTGEYCKGDEPLPRSKERDVLRWLETWRDAILEAWNACRDEEVPSQIPPLY